MELNNIYNEDCISGIKKIKDNSIDIVITSPPYNLDIKYSDYDDKKPLEDYLDFVKKLCKELFRVTKDGGRVCFNIPPDIGNLKDNSKVSLDSLYYNILSEVGFHYRTKIIWNKNTISARTAWGSFCSPSNPNVLPSFEYVLVFYKENPKKEGLKENIDIIKDEFIPWTNGLWTIATESAKKIGHPAPYPVELCTRLLKMFSYKNDVVLDPFMGSGTTAVSAININRNYIGFELSKEYCDIANNRISKEVC